jgi:hypothetical protein
MTLAGEKGTTQSFFVHEFLPRRNLYLLKVTTFKLSKTTKLATVHNAQ